jgi:hypothetical protein
MNWNAVIMKAIKQAEKVKGSKLAAGEITVEARKIMAQFGIGGMPFVKYGSERLEAP